MKRHDIRKALTNSAGYRRELIGDPQCLVNLIEVNCTNTTDRCVYDDENQEWISKPFEPLPRGFFKWKQEDQLKQGRVGFILDTGSQLNILNTADATKNGIHTETLPDIELHIK